MHFIGFACLLVISKVYCLPQGNSDSVKLGVQIHSGTTKLAQLLRNRRSPVPDPHHHHHHSKIHAHVHIHGHYSEPTYYAKPVAVLQPVVVKPVAVPVKQDVLVSTACNTCGGGYESNSHSQASSSSFSAGLHSPFGGLGFSSSSAQSSAHAAAAGYGK